MGLVALVIVGCAGGVTTPATGVTDTGATVTGIVFDPSDATISYWFQYGQTTAYASETTHRSLVISDRDNHPVSEDLTGLSPGTTYHYQVCAEDPVPICGGDRSFTTTGVATQLSITAQPTLYPDFDPAVSDYVTRCGAGPVTMTVSTPSGTSVAIAGGPTRNGQFTQDVPLTSGKSFSFSTTTSGQTSTFHVRCLPGDFPNWTYTRPGTPRGSFYITTPQGATAPGGQSARRYVAIFDAHGVPVWWQPSPATDAKVLADGTLAWYTSAAGGTSTPGFEIHRLDGSLVHTWRTVGSDTDLHDFQLLANGDALLLTYPPRAGTVDLSPYGGPSQNATVLDAEIQEVTPNGTLVWSWNTKDHIPLSETGQRWWSFMPVGTLPDGRQTYDYAHINSIEQTGNAIVASFRHFDAVYQINKSSGQIIYKLGGTSRPESLTVLGDPQSAYPLGGQHYARVLADGTLTLHDNNTFLSSAPRSVRYRIDLFAKTAQLLEQVSDPDAPISFCCGSAQRLGDGTWVMSWGGTPIVTEFAPDGTRDFELTFAGPAINYRVDTITGGTPSITDLRAGMDAMP